MRTALVTFSLLIGVAAGCTSPAPESGSAPEARNAGETQAAQADRQAAGKIAEKAEHRFGIERLIHAALRDPSLTAQQTDQIKAIEQGLEAQREAGKQAHQTLRAALVKDVAAGQIDDAGLAAPKAAVLAAAQKHAAAAADALNQLHQVLTAAQRQTLVKRVEDKIAAHSALWLQRAPSNAPPHNAMFDSRPSSKGEHPFGARMKAMHEKMAAELGLDEAQRAEVKDAMHALFEKNKPSPEELEARKEQLKSALTAFAGDSFDANSLGLPALVQQMAQKRIDMHIARLRVLLGVVRPEQLPKLSEMVAKGPQPPMAHEEHGEEAE